MSDNSDRSSAMTSRERVLRALNYQQVDRVPVDLGGTLGTGAHVSVIANLRQALGLDERGDRVKVVEPYQMLGEVAADLREMLEIDTVNLPGPKNHFGFADADWKPWRTFDGTDVLVGGKFNTDPEPNGDIFQYPQGDKSAPPSGRMPRGGFYFDDIVRQEPIDDARLDPADNLEDFSLLSDEALRLYEERARDLYDNTNLAITTGLPGTAFGDIALVPGAFLKHPKGIRDIEEWYISTISRRQYIKDVFAGQAEIAVENLKRIHQAVGDRLCAVWLDGTDLAAQNTLFCGPDTYRELYMPFSKKLNDWIHTHTKWKTMKHCCGGCELLIEGFIEAGFDILNPVQTSAKGMDPQLLVDKYGGRIIFWGGGADTQKTLPFGQPDQV
ncbi:MAG: uroporphyrinogen decarboxylase family protein, partial [Planctomycetota bacterium]